MKVNFTHLIAFIWAVLVTFLILLMLYSCSASFHYTKAVKKGLRCETISDTIEIQKIDSVYINNDIKYKTKIEYKTIKKKWNFPIKILIICFAIGFVIALLKVYIKK
jgi:RsiW-degrading membrane proteinase PrsW (M82 family)